MTNGVTVRNNICAMGGSDEKGLFVCWGPMLREVYCIMIQIDGKWKPYKIYKNNKPKTLKRAKQHLKYYRVRYVEAFKLEEIWEDVPVSEMEKTYYENEKEIAAEICERTGADGRRIVVGMGPREHTKRFLDPEREKDQVILREILKVAGPEGTELRADPIWGDDDGRTNQGTED